MDEFQISKKTKEAAPSLVESLQAENTELKSQIAEMDSAMSELLLNVIPSLLPQ